MEEEEKKQHLGCGGVKFSCHDVMGVSYCVS